MGRGLPPAPAPSRRPSRAPTGPAGFPTPLRSAPEPGEQAPGRAAGGFESPPPRPRRRAIAPLDPGATVAVRVREGGEETEGVAGRRQAGRRDAGRSRRAGRAPDLLDLAPGAPDRLDFAPGAPDLLA